MIMAAIISPSRHVRKNAVDVIMTAMLIAAAAIVATVGVFLTSIIVTVAALVVTTGLEVVKIIVETSSLVIQLTIFVPTIIVIPEIFSRTFIIVIATMA